MSRPFVAPGPIVIVLLSTLMAYYEGEKSLSDIKLADFCGNNTMSTASCGLPH